jgi:serine protease AprX
MVRMNHLFSKLFRNRFRWAAFCLLLALWIVPVSRIVARPTPQTVQPEQPNAPSAAAEISSALLTQLAEGNVPDSFLVILDEQIDPHEFSRPVPLSAAANEANSEAGNEAGNERAAHIARLYAALTETAQRSQAPVRAYLGAQGIHYRPFYIVNMIEVRLDTSPQSATSEAAASLLDTLAGLPGVDRIVANPQVDARHQLASPEIGADAQVVTAQYGLSYTGAITVWSQGYRGQGIVIANQDTGIQWDHPALISAYRGWNPDAEIASHPYNWFDAWADAGDQDFCVGDPQIPCDDHGHGTHTAGTAVGDAGGDIGELGMAPQAQWIGCRNMLNGFGRPSTYAACFEFFLAPYPQSGDPFTDGNPALAPHIISNSWGCPPSEGCDVSSLRQVVEVARAAGQFVVASAGNSGGIGCGSVVDPIAIHDATFTVGAHGSSGDLAGFSSRGPVTIDGSNRLKPDITAPGVGIYSTYRNNSYATLNGTSMAAPHVAGAVALLWSAVPSLIGAIDLTEQILLKSATPVPDNRCDDGEPASPNHAYGYGRLNVAAAVEMALRPASLRVTALDADGEPQPGTPVRVVNSNTGTQTGTTGADGSLTFDELYAGVYTVWIENRQGVCESQPILVDLEPNGQHQISQAEQFCLLLPLISTK